MAASRKRTTSTASTPSAAVASDAPGSSPPRRCSPRKLAANRANARKSTGPRTPEGKARSRLNAVKHGLCASVGLLPGEDGEALRELSAAVHADLRPRGQAEAGLVDQYVSILWKLRRLGAAELGVAADDFGTEIGRWFEMRDNHYWALKQPGLKEDAEAEGLPPVPEQKSGSEMMVEDLLKGAGPLLRLMELEMRLRGTLSAVLKQLKDLRALRRQQAKDEAEEDDGGAGAWEPGEWDNDPDRWGSRFAAEGDEPEDDNPEDDDQEDDDQEGDEGGERGLGGDGGEGSDEGAAGDGAPARNEPNGAAVPPAAERGDVVTTPLPTGPDPARSMGRGTEQGTLHGRSHDRLDDPDAVVDGFTPGGGGGGGGGGDAGERLRRPGAGAGDVGRPGCGEGGDR